MLNISLTEEISAWFATQNLYSKNCRFYLKISLVRMNVEVSVKKMIHWPKNLKINFKEFRFFIFKLESVQF